MRVIRPIPSDAQSSIQPKHHWCIPPGWRLRDATLDLTGSLIHLRFQGDWRAKFTIGMVLVDSDLTVEHRQDQPG